MAYPAKHASQREPGDVAWIIFLSEQVPVREGGRLVYARFTARSRLTKERLRPIGQVYAPDRETALKRAKARFKKRHPVANLSVQSSISAVIAAEDRSIVRQQRHEGTGHYYVGRATKRDDAKAP